MSCSNPEAFAVVDAQFVESVRDVLEQLGPVPRPRGDTAALVLRDVIDSAPDTESVVLRVRAAQVAMLRRGHLVEVNTSALLGAAELFGRRGFAESEDWWVRLADYWDPDVPAAVALRVASLTARDLPELVISDITPHTPDSVTVDAPDGSTLHLEGQPARYVTALYVMRLARHGDPSAQLFMTHRAKRIAYQFARDRLSAAPALEVGVEGPGSLDESGPRLWLHRYGVAVRPVWKGNRATAKR